MDAGAYKTVETLGKSPLELVLQVYDGAISELTTARGKYADHKFADGYNHIQRAERMITHLYTTLDMDAGGEVAVNLAKLYAWVITKLHEVQATKETARFDECLRVLANLREAWAAIRTQATPPRTPVNEATVPGDRVEMVG
jgi:flagellar protein FliS